MESIRFFQFNTACEVAVYDAGVDTKRILGKAKETAAGVRRMLDFYDPDSELGRLNARHRPGRPYPVSAGLFSVLQRMLRFSLLSENRFDPTIAPAVRLWNITADRPAPPPRDALRTTMECVGSRNIRLDQNNRTVTFLHENMSIDAGGAGKGYAADRVAIMLRRNGVTSASVDFGGNLYVLGTRFGQPWRVGVQAPWRERGESLGVLTLTDCAVSTSGAYERFFEQGGEVFHHILDPRTGEPVRNAIGSATVICRQAMLADMLSTACFVVGESGLDGLIGRVPRVQKAGWLLVRENGSVAVSRRMEGAYRPKLQEGETIG